MSDDMDIDIDVDEDFEEEIKSSSSFKDMWDNNPFMKIGSLVIVAVVVGVIYTQFIASSEDKAEDTSSIQGGSSIRGTVGEDASVEYKDAIKETNEQRKDWAQRSGTSALPTPIGKPRGQLEISDRIDPKNLSIDPLQEWRKTAEARRFEMDFPEEDIDETPLPEMVPIVEPIRPDTTTVIDPELVGLFAEQMATIISSKEPKPAEAQMVTNVASEYMIFVEEQLEEEDARGNNISDGKGGIIYEREAEAEVLVAAGSVVYAQLLTNLNSDIPGPALAHILSGPMAGARAIGSFSKEDEYLVITFKTLVKDDISYSVDAIALDPDTTLNALSSDVNHHYFTRIILPAAAEFVSGVGEGIAQTDVSVTTDGGGSATSSQESLDTREIVGKATQKSFDKVSEIVDAGSDRDITVTVDKGTPMGLLFLETLTEELVEDDETLAENAGE